MNSLSTFLKTRQGKIVLVLFAGVFMPFFCIWSVRDFVYRTQTQLLERNFVSALDELQKAPPGLQRAEGFVKRLKGIDTRLVPREVREALQDYIGASERGLENVKAGYKEGGTDQEIAAARTRLLAAVRRND